MAETGDPILRLDAGNRNVLRETEPGTVEVRYRGLRRLCARDLVRVANGAWYVRFEETGMTLTLTNGAAEPEQDNIALEPRTGANHRGTLNVRKGTSSLLTGKFATKWLGGDSMNLEIVIEPTHFSMLELKQPLHSLRKHKPELFSRPAGDRWRKPVRTSRKEALKSARGGRRR